MKLLGLRFKKNDAFGSSRNSVYPTLRLRRMCRTASDNRFKDGDTLMSVHQFHAGWFTNDGSLWHRNVPNHASDEGRCAQTTYLLVITEHQMQRPLEIELDHFRHKRHHHCDKTLHIASAAPIKQSIPFYHIERFTLPILTLHRHYIRMTGENNTAFDHWTDCSYHICLGPILIRGYVA